MGWLEIPLDMMTITIAAISIGIAVDDSIHYMFRMRLEFHNTGSYMKAMELSHNSIGRAMYYTSVTIILGFLILVVSKFWPTIYFGALPALAMLVALVFSLTLLPRLIILFKPFGKEFTVTEGVG
jgi:predicted RND superfamily exporter protein